MFYRTCSALLVVFFLGGCSAIVASKLNDKDKKSDGGAGNRDGTRGDGRAVDTIRKLDIKVPPGTVAGENGNLGPAFLVGERICFGLSPDILAVAKFAFVGEMVCPGEVSGPNFCCTIAPYTKDGPVQYQVIDANKTALATGNLTVNRLIIIGDNTNRALMLEANKLNQLGDLFSVPGNSTNQASDNEPVFSPSGRYLAFHREVNQKLVIGVVDVVLRTFAAVSMENASPYDQLIFEPEFKVGWSINANRQAAINVPEKALWVISNNEGKLWRVDLPSFPQTLANGAQLTAKEIIAGPTGSDFQHLNFLHNREGKKFMLALRGQQVFFTDSNNVSAINTIAGGSGDGEKIVTVMSPDSAAITSSTEFDQLAVVFSVKESIHYANVFRLQNGMLVKSSQETKIVYKDTSGQVVTEITPTPDDFIEIAGSNLVGFDVPSTPGTNFFYGIVRNLGTIAQPSYTLIINNFNSFTRSDNSEFSTQPANISLGTVGFGRMMFTWDNQVALVEMQKDTLAPVLKPYSLSHWGNMLIHHPRVEQIYYLENNKINIATYSYTAPNTLSTLGVGANKDYSSYSTSQQIGFFMQP